MNLSAIPENSLAGVLEARSQEKMSSLCDRCYAPGACCREMGLHSHDLRIPRGDTEHYMLISSERKANILMDVLNLPFRFKENKSRGGAVFICPRLQLDGRCGDYENRPDVCRIFEPASDILCVHYRGAEAGEDLGHAWWSELP